MQMESCLITLHIDIYIDCSQKDRQNKVLYSFFSLDLPEIWNTQQLLRYRPRE